MAVVKSVKLHFKGGTSDKIYIASIEGSGNQYVVNFAHGRRGGNMKPGTKTVNPVSLKTAHSIYDKLVAEKVGKGYKVIGTADETVNTVEDESIYTYTESTQTTISPQLLNPIDEDECDRCLSDDNFWAQEKMDGWRVLIRKNGTNVDGINRKAKTRELPSTIHAEALTIQYDFIIDGELIGDVFYAFDILYSNASRSNKTIVQDRPYSDRLQLLRSILTEFPLKTIKTVETAKTKAEKAKLLKRLRSEEKEGIVFKQVSAAYSPGRPASGGPQLKHKFYATCTCRVAEGRQGKRSAGLELLDGKEWIPVGNVTIPPNKEIPDVSQKVEIRYLYAYKGGSLYQPIYIGVRDDIDDAECTIKQLKYKAETDEE